MFSPSNSYEKEPETPETLNILETVPQRTVPANFPSTEEGMSLHIYPRFVLRTKRTADATEDEIFPVSLTGRCGAWNEALWTLCQWHTVILSGRESMHRLIMCRCLSLSIIYIYIYILEIREYNKW